MSISMTRYVSITSGVGGNAGVRQRDLIGRIYTNNAGVSMIPLEFTTLADVGTYFGTAGNEYSRASFYFGFVSKNIRAPQKISFARAGAAAAPRIFGNKVAKSLATFTPVTSGSLSLTFGATPLVLTGINLSSATSLLNVASLIQAAIRTNADPQYATATVDFDATRSQFALTGAVAGDFASSVQTPATGTNLAPLLGWTTGAAMLGGNAVMSLTAALNAGIQASNNFGSFAFSSDITMTPALKLEASQWVNAQNVSYMYCCRDVSIADLTQTDTDARSLAGVASTYAPLVAEFPEMAPMALMAATDYTQRNAVANYMFQQFALTPSVLNDVDANGIDALRANYYGNTQTAGQTLNFYQRGVLKGTSTAPVDMNTFANEMWLKDAFTATLMSGLLSLNRISANNTGRAQVLALLQDPINQALFNGTISVGKTLSVVQRLYIAQITGSDLAYLQVQSLGYWLNVTMQSYVTTDGRTEFKAVYTLVYSKDDAIRKIEGTDILI